jgi:ribonuclease E
MWPPVPAEASWSAGFERFVRTCVVVCLAIAAGAVAGGVGVYATVGPAETPRNVPVETHAINELPPPLPQTAAQTDIQISAPANAAMAEVVPAPAPADRSTASRSARVKPFGRRWGVPGSATRTVVLGAVAPQTEQPESAPAMPPQAAIVPEVIANATPAAAPAPAPEVRSSDAAAPSADERPKPARAMRKTSRAVAATSDPTLPTAGAQKAAKSHTAAVAAQSRPGGHQQPRNPITALFGALFGGQRASVN